jgi:hypothetical protein
MGIRGRSTPRSKTAKRKPNLRMHGDVPPTLSPQLKSRIEINSSTLRPDTDGQLDVPLPKSMVVRSHLGLLSPMIVHAPARPRTLPELWLPHRFRSCMPRLRLQPAVQAPWALGSLGYSPGYRCWLGNFITSLPNRASKSISQKIAKEFFKPIPAHDQRSLTAKRLSVCLIARSGLDPLITAYDP